MFHCLNAYTINAISSFTNWTVVGRILELTFQTVVQQQQQQQQQSLFILLVFFVRLQCSITFRKHTKLNIARTGCNPLSISVKKILKRKTSKINNHYKIFHSKRFSDFIDANVLSSLYNGAACINNYTPWKEIMPILLFLSCKLTLSQTLTSIPNCMHK